VLAADSPTLTVPVWAAVVGALATSGLAARGLVRYERLRREPRSPAV
jgi:hypothetical protein